MSKVIRIALISGIHCHKKRTKAQNSFLLTSTPKIPTKENPLASLNELIEENEMEADLLLVPRDFCDQMDEDGFNFGWSGNIRVASKLKAKAIIPTIGKDDVFRFARNMDSDFSFKLHY